MTAQSEFVRVERDGPFGTIVLSRPDRRNALKSQMYADIGKALIALDSDPDVRVILMRGEGRDFCAGNDISDFKAYGEAVEKRGVTPTSVLGRSTPSIDLVFVMKEVAKPIIAAVQGNAVGFGATLLLLIDAVVVEPDAKIRFPFVDLGLVPEAGSTQLLRERVGYLKAAQLLLGAGMVGAEEALAIGLATLGAEAGQGYSKALELAQLWASKPEASVRETKRLIRRQAEDLGDRMMEEFRVVVDLTSSPEAQAVFTRMMKK